MSHQIYIFKTPPLHSRHQIFHLLDLLPNLQVVSATRLVIIKSSWATTSIQNRAVLAKILRTTALGSGDYTA